jgi:hypothetical protein
MVRKTGKSHLPVIAALLFVLTGFASQSEAGVNVNVGEGGVNVDLGGEGVNVNVEPRNGERIYTLQRRIDDGRISGRLPQTEGREFQGRLDSIRGDYMRMTDEGRYATHEERADVSRRLDSLETDLNRFR